MAARYMSKLQASGKIAIPAEICTREEFMLKKGVHLRQSIDASSIVLYKPSGESVRTSATATNQLDSGYTIELAQDYLEQLSMEEGEPLYFSVVDDLVVIQKACCNKCGTEEHIVEYSTYNLRCTNCIANTIYWEEAHRR